MTTDNPHILIPLPNGIRVVLLPVRHSEIVHAGFMINTGSRDENPQNNGVAHFIEHTVFKGTARRKSHHILRRIENVGGELNAYTSREKTCYYASCLKQYAARAVDLLADITFSSLFPEPEIEKEKKVILEEIDMYDDSPEESLYDDYYSLIFPGHPLGYNILGTKDTVNAMSRETILDFIAGNYSAERIVLSLVGDLTARQAEALALRLLAKAELRSVQAVDRKAPEMALGFHEVRQKDFAQAHCIMGAPAYSRHDDRRYALSLVNNILGGAGMSARLNMAVREKHGLTYHISSHYSGYDDCGVLSIYFACDNNNVNRCRDLTNKELKLLRERSLTERQLSQAKIQLMGQMAQVVENNGMQMQHQARSVLDYDRAVAFREFMDGIEAVTASDILAVCNETFDPARMSSLLYEGEKE